LILASAAKIAERYSGYRIAYDFLSSDFPMAQCQFSGDAFAFAGTKSRSDKSHLKSSLYDLDPNPPPLSVQLSAELRQSAWHGTRLRELGNNKVVVSLKNLSASST
jgi:hypothetical protein